MVSCTGQLTYLYLLAIPDLYRGSCLANHEVMGDPAAAACLRVHILIMSVHPGDDIVGCLYSVVSHHEERSRHAD